MAVFCVLPDKYRMAVGLVVNWRRYTKATSDTYERVDLGLEEPARPGPFCRLWARACWSRYALTMMSFVRAHDAAAGDVAGDDWRFRHLRASGLAR